MERFSHALRAKISQLALLLVLFGGLVLFYSLSTPLFEAPDEVWHYAYVRWLAEGHGLPSMLDDASGANQETAQPPLYYAVAALLSAPFGDADLEALFWHNPNFGYQAPKHVPDNKNMLIHTGRERWPWDETVLAIRAARLASWLFGLITVAAAYGLGREALKAPWGAPLTALVVALTPQFLFISGVVSNDSATAAMATLALWALARALNHGITLRHSLLSGALVGLAAITKVSNIALAPLAVLVWFYVALRHKQAQSEPLSLPALVFNKPMLALCLAALLTGGWWYARNLVLYGDPLALTMHTHQPWARPEPASLKLLLSELPMVYRSFWGAFGWGHVEYPPWIYVLLGLPILLGVAGWILVARNNTLKPRRLLQDHTPLILCGVWFAMVFAALMLWMRSLGAPHGRLLFPAVAAWAVLLAGGWQRIRMTKDESRMTKDEGKPRLPTNSVLYLAIAGLLLLNLATPLLVIRPAFAQPRLVEPEAAAATVDGPALTYGDAIRLLGVTLDRDSVAPGGVLTLRACWVTEQPIDHDYSVFVHLIGRDNARPGERYTYPGLGRFPTSLWPANRAFCDTYRVTVEPWAAVPERYDVLLGLYDDVSGERLSPSSDPPVVAQVRIVPAKPLQVTPQHTLDAHLGDAVTLLGYDAPATLTAGQPLSLTLYWQAERDLHDEYKVFVHLLDESGAILAQSDATPRAGHYPTSAWRARDVIPDTHILATEALPPGQSGQLRVGLYAPEAVTRLPVSGADAAASADAAVLQSIRIVAP